MGKPTIKDVARLAEVSVSTVSRVLNGKENVQAEYVTKTLDAVKQLKFKPSIAAKTIRGQSSKVIGMLIPEVTTPFYARVANGAVSRAQELGLFIQLMTSDRDKEIEAQCIRQLSESYIDGLIYGPLETGAPFTQSALLQVPTAVVAHRRILENTPHIYVDNFAGGYTAAKYLIRLGRRRIYMLAGFWLPGLIRKEDLLSSDYDSKLSGAYSGFDRTLGYRKALQEDGIPFDEALVGICGYDYDSGYNAIKIVYERMIDIDAVIAPNDMVAAGIMNFLKRQNIKIPETVSLIGHGDVLIPEIAEPPLTSINQNPHEVGRQAVNTIDNMLKHKEVSDTVVGVSLSIRESTCNKPSMI